MAEGLFAVCIQHELDHLNGKLFIDYLSRLKRERIRKKLEKKHRDDIKDALYEAKVKAQEQAKLDAQAWAKLG